MKRDTKFTIIFCVAVCISAYGYSLAFGPTVTEGVTDDGVQYVCVYDD